MRRGEIWRVDLEPVRGSEANKQRPAVIVSNDAANSTERLGRGVIIVVPVSSNLRACTRSRFSSRRTRPGFGATPRPLAEQVRAVDAQRLAQRLHLAL